MHILPYSLSESHTIFSTLTPSLSPPLSLYDFLPHSPSITLSLTLPLSLSPSLFLHSPSPSLSLYHSLPHFPSLYQPITRSPSPSPPSFRPSQISQINASSEEGEVPDDLSGNIQFSDVIFHYPARPDVQVLRGLDLNIGSGQTVALVGPSGCGKSTTIQLIQRFYDAEAGQVGVM